MAMQFACEIRAFALVSSDDRRRQRKIPAPDVIEPQEIRSHNVLIHNPPKRQVYWSNVLAHLKNCRRRNNNRYTEIFRLFRKVSGFSEKRSAA
jgi:hypothetical protein